MPQLWVVAGPNGAGKTTLERRYATSLMRLDRALAFADRSYLFDNSGSRRQLVIIRDEGRIRFAAPVLPEWIRNSPAVLDALAAG